MSCGGGHIEECKHCKRLFMYSLGSVCNLIKNKLYIHFPIGTLEVVDIDTKKHWFLEPELVLLTCLFIQNLFSIQSTF
jgi:hypothetical protein